MIKSLELIPKCICHQTRTSDQAPVQRTHNNAIKESHFIGTEGRPILRGAGFTSVYANLPKAKRNGQSCDNDSKNGILIMNQDDAVSGSEVCTRNASAAAVGIPTAQCAHSLPRRSGKIHTKIGGFSSVGAMTTVSAGSLFPPSHLGEDAAAGAALAVVCYYLRCLLISSYKYTYSNSSR